MAGKGKEVYEPNEEKTQTGEKERRGREEGGGMGEGGEKGVETEAVESAG
jgi:hypothetical protein